ncbi:MAG: hypothetical protein Q9209_007065 [Squamulea sp. 1 TL-2023]
MPSADYPSVSENKVPPASVPPPYHSRPEENPDLTAAFSSLNLTALSNKPTPDQCLAHPKLLEAFHNLREDVATTDGLFGIYDYFVDRVYPNQGFDEKRAQLLLRLREKRWAVYVAKAERRPARRALGDIYDNFENTSEIPRLEFDRNTLPPLDVLMAWHAHLLNPRDFLEDCVRYGKALFWNTGLPLAIIDPCIDIRTFEYYTSESSPLQFHRATGFEWNSLDDDQQHTFNCPKCAMPKQVMWTTLITADFWEESSHKDRGFGFADPDFRTSCHQCLTPITHETLRVRKFQNDRKALLQKDLPMPGTLLNTKGRLQPLSHSRDLEDHAPLFPNLLLKMFRSPSFEELDKPEATMNDVRSIIERVIQILQSRRILTKRSQEQRFAIRKMMSRYWNNSSMFALDLSGAIIRQGTFIEKMHAIDWLHSPAVHSTMQRLLIKYGRYFAILKIHEGKTAVPTLDILASLGLCIRVILPVRPLQLAQRVIAARVPVGEVLQLADAMVEQTEVEMLVEAEADVEEVQVGVVEEGVVETDSEGL